MELGVVIPHTGPSASREFVREICTLADTTGLDALWAVDHLVMPYHVESPYVLGRRPSPVADGAVAQLLAPNFEMLTTLAWVAGFTDRIALGTSISVLPMRNAVANARQLATLDELSGGRVRFGVGVGWLREEVEALGMPWANRGRRSEEHIALLRHLWCAEGDVVEFHGEFHDIPPIHPEPRPRQRPIPIYIGGHSDAAIERAGRIGDGWIAAPMSPPRVAEHWTRVRAAAERAGRDPGALALVVAEAPQPGRSRAELVVDYAEVGVTHLQVRVDGDLNVARDEIHELATINLG